MPKQRTSTHHTSGDDAPSGSARHLATVKTWIHHKSYGFLIPDDYWEPEVYVHISNVSGEQPLATGYRVSYRLAAERRGPRAVVVEIVDDGSGDKWNTPSDGEASYER